MRYTFDPIIVDGRKYRWLEPIVVTCSSQQRISCSSATALPANDDLKIIWMAGNTGRWKVWETQDIPTEFKVFVEDFETIPQRWYEYDPRNLLRAFLTTQHKE